MGGVMVFYTSVKIFSLVRRRLILGYQIEVPREKNKPYANQQTNFLTEGSALKCFDLKSPTLSKQCSSSHYKMLPKISKVGK